MGFPREEHWSVLPFPSPGDLPNPGIKPGSPILQEALATREDHSAENKAAVLFQEKLYGREGYMWKPG